MFVDCWVKIGIRFEIVCSLNSRPISDTADLYSDCVISGRSGTVSLVVYVSTRHSSEASIYQLSDRMFCNNSRDICLNTSINMADGNFPTRASNVGFIWFFSNVDTSIYCRVCMHVCVCVCVSLSFISVCHRSGIIQKQKIANIDTNVYQR